MHTVDLIRQTLDALFAQYRNYSKTTFTLSINVLLILGVATALLALPVFLLMDFLEIGLNYNLDLWEQLYYPDTMYRIRLQNFSYGINLFGMAIFGYYLLRSKPEATPLKSTRDVFDHIPERQKLLLLLLLGGFWLFFIFTLPYLFSFELGSANGFFDAWSMGYPENIPFLQWLDSFFEWLKGFVPPVLVFLLLIAFYEGKLQVQGIKKYRSALLAAFVLLFVFDATWLSIHSLLRTYFMGLITLPFPHLLIPTLIGFFAELALLAFFTVANAFVLVYPFYLVHRFSAEQTPNPEAAAVPMP